MYRKMKKASSLNKPLLMLKPKQQKSRRNSKKHELIRKLLMPNLLVSMMKSMVPRAVSTQSSLN